MPFKRRWLTFSITTLLRVVAAVSVWLASQVNSARQQRDAVRAVRQLGGVVDYDPVPHGHERLSRIVGDEYFQDVIQLI